MASKTSIWNIYFNEENLLWSFQWGHKGELDSLKRTAYLIVKRTTYSDSNLFLMVVYRVKNSNWKKESCQIIHHTSMKIYMYVVHVSYDLKVKTTDICARICTPCQYRSRIKKGSWGRGAFSSGLGRSSSMESTKLYRSMINVFA